MESNEWCALVHVDIGMRTGLEVVEEALREFVAAANAAAGTISVVALKDERRPNHFEVVGRFASEGAYHEHQVAPANLAFRRSVGPVLGSPYEDRLHGARGAQRWPSASEGTFVVITQAEARPDQLKSAGERFDAFAAEQAIAEGLLGQVALERRYLPNNLELVSVWRGPEAFDAFAGSEGATSSRAEFEALLLAPLEHRRFEILAGEWTSP